MAEAGTLIDYATTPKQAATRTIVWLRRFFWATALCMPMQVVLVHASYLVGRLQLGRWPIPPDQGNHTWSAPFEILALLLIPTCMVAVPAHLFFAMLFTALDAHERNVQRILIDLASVALIPLALLVAEWDPIHAYWYFWD